jgi:hypothetical protein
MAEQSHQLVQKLWNYCNILRDDGLSYGDYPLPFDKLSPVPKNVDRQSFWRQ